MGGCCFVSNPYCRYGDLDLWILVYLMSRFNGRVSCNAPPELGFGNVPSLNRNSAGFIVDVLLALYILFIFVEFNVFLM
jgi:hypothetical protein